MPPEGGRTRELWLSRRRMRWLVGGVATAALVVLAAASLLITPWGTPGARMVAAENAELRRELAADGRSPDTGRQRVVRQPGQHRAHRIRH